MLYISYGVLRRQPVGDDVSLLGDNVQLRPPRAAGTLTVVVVGAKDPHRRPCEMQMMAGHGSSTGLGVAPRMQDRLLTLASRVLDWKRNHRS